MTMMMMTMMMLSMMISMNIYRHLLYTRHSVTSFTHTSLFNSHISPYEVGISTGHIHILGNWGLLGLNNLSRTTQ